MIILFFISCNISNSTSNLNIDKSKSIFEFYASKKLYNYSAEISVFDSTSKRLFTVYGDNFIIVTNLSGLKIDNKVIPEAEYIIDLSSFGNFKGANSLAVNNSYLAVALSSEIITDNGAVLLFDLTKQNSSKWSPAYRFSVGALPDMVTFTPDGEKIIVACEGEEENTIDPKGSIYIINLNTFKATALDFTKFNSEMTELLKQGFRIAKKNNPLNLDIEPEYITVSDDSRYAYITLQENNAVARVNIETESIESVHGLGFKNFNIDKNKY